MTLENKTGTAMTHKQSRLEKWFPPRQILLRSSAEVRCLTFSPLVQKILAGTLALGFLWVGYASYNTIFRDEIVKAKDNEIAGLEAENARKAEDIEALQTTILKKTENLEQRQGYLKSLIEADPTGALPAPEEEETESEADPKHESFSGPPGFLIASARAATDPAINTGTFLNYITGRLATLEAGQNEMALALNAFAENRLTDINDMLAPFKLTADDLARAVNAKTSSPGQGGPFVPKATSGIDFTSDNPFAMLQKNWDTLVRVYTGFQNIPLYEPVKEFYLSSRFGRRTDPFTKKPGWHPGLDLAGWPGTKIFATTEGTVTKAGSWGGYGNMVEIDHGNGFMTRYAHMRKVIAKRGQNVKPGEILGEMGCTGRCESTHLHYEVYFNGKLRNPQPFMEAPEDVQQAKKRANTPELNPETGD